jgi:hypothetical protein
MKIRYVGPDPAGVELVCSGRSFGVVEQDAVVEIPDEIYAAHAWPEANWAEVGTAKKQQEGDV